MNDTLDAIMTTDLRYLECAQRDIVNAGLGRKDILAFWLGEPDEVTPDFIRKELFKPFASTKQNGFGIGAAEARALVLAMDGELDVVSVEGEGTRFLVRFPLISSTDSGT